MCLPKNIPNVCVNSTTDLLPIPLIQYESESAPDMDKQNLFTGLANLRHKKLSFMRGNVNFSPFEGLSAEYAGWHRQ